MVTIPGFDGNTPCWIPDIPTGRTEKRRLRIAQFGDGYAQRTLDGINAMETRWRVVFNLRDEDVVKGMVAYLIARKGNSFSFYEQQTDTMHDVWCDEWEVDWSIRRRQYAGGVTVPGVYYGTLSAEFVKAYGVTA